MHAPVETVIRGAVPCAMPLSQVDSRPDQGVSQARTHKYIGKPRERFLNLKKQVIFLLFYFKVKNLNINTIRLILYITNITYIDALLYVRTLAGNLKTK